jgi:SAM-dependent methyltransferase
LKEEIYYQYSLKFKSTLTVDNFTEIPFSIETLDLYYIRNSILKVIIKVIPELKGRLLDIGCGQMPYREFIITKSKVTEYKGIDLESALIYNKDIRPDYFWDGIQLPFGDNEYDTIIMTEVLEHTPNPIITLKETHRVLARNGILVFTVPFLWPLHEVPNDEFRYTPFSLKRILEQSGFVNINIYPTGGWHASLAQMLGLWVRRSGLSNWKRELFSQLIKPLIRYLISKDKVPIDFIEGQMITGLYGFAYKSLNK